MATKNKAEVRIDLSDVLKHGGVPQAIAECVDDPILVADSRAMGGQTFACSGPGAGWSRTFDVNDYAKAAITEDIANSGCDPSASQAIDPTDGRIASGVDPDGEDEEWGGEVEWTEESVVELICPDVADALEHPDAVADMAQWVIDAHGPCSDRAAWKALIISVRAAAEALEDIDADEIDA